MYQRGLGKPFDLAHCWDILRKAPRWATQEDRMSMPRPMGIRRAKAAKAAKENKKKLETALKAFEKSISNTENLKLCL